MYVISVYYNGKLKSYVSDINYKNGSWNDSVRPKIFKTLKSAKRCTEQINQWAPSIEFKVMKLEEVVE